MGSRLIPLVPPAKGLNTINPLVDFESGYARELTNYFMTTGGLKIRPNVGNIYIKTGANTIFHHDGQYAISDNGDIYNLATNSTSSDIGGACQRRAGSYVKHLSLDLVFGGRQPRIVAYPFTAWTITPISGGITATAIVAGCSHKARLYYTDGTTIEYTDIGQITGAVVDGFGGKFLVSQFMDGQLISRIFSITAPSGNLTENVFVIFGKGGKVLVYAGDYPGSASWSLIGTHDMSAPIGGDVGYVEKDGDIYVPTLKYAYLARDLLLGGGYAYENRLTKDIENLWQNQNWGQPTAAEVPHSFHLDRDSVSGTIYDLFITMCSQWDVDFGAGGRYKNDGMYFVYNRINKHWSIWIMTPLYAPVRAVAGIVTGTTEDGGLSYIGNDPEMRDFYELSNAAATVDIITSWKTPYTPYYEGRYQKLTGVRPFFKNTSSGYLDKFRAIYDYSDLNAPYGFYTQPLSTEINPDKFSDAQIDLAMNTHGYYQGFKGLAGAGTSVSLQFSQTRKQGSANKQSHEVYGGTAYVSDGGILY